MATPAATITQGPTRTSPASNAQGTSAAMTPTTSPTSNGEVTNTRSAATSAATGKARLIVNVPPHDRSLPSLMNRGYDGGASRGTVPWYRLRPSLGTGEDRRSVRRETSGGPMYRTPSDPTMSGVRPLSRG